jgi:hypothetical protein
MTTNTKQIVSTEHAGAITLEGRKAPLQVYVTTYDDGSTYTELRGNRGAAYFLRQVGMTDTGLYDVLSWAGYPMRDKAQRAIRVTLLGGIFEQVKR